MAKRNVTIPQNVTCKTNIYLTQGNKIPSFHLFSKRQCQLNTTSLQVSYAGLYYADVPHAMKFMSRNADIPHPVSDDTPE